MENNQLWLMLGAFAVFMVVAVWGITRSDRFRASLKNWFTLDSGKHHAKDSTVVEKIRNDSEIDLTSVKERDIHVSDVDKSKVTIRK
jgi:hypothetical protein